MPLISYHCFIKSFLAEGSSSLSIHLKEECLFNRELYIGNIMHGSKLSGIINNRSAQIYHFFLEEDQESSDMSLSFLD